MKTSELIRTAVDKFLWAGPPCPYNDMKISEYLCWCMVMTHTAPTVGLQKTLCQCPQQIQDICKILTEETGFFYDNGGVERQMQRFMYSEFLALYFEDMGD